jgi:hypothetical protein
MRAMRGETTTVRSRKTREHFFSFFSFSFLPFFLFFLFSSFFVQTFILFYFILFFLIYSYLFFYSNTFVVGREGGSGKGCGEMSHLIRDEGDEGRDHESETTKDQGAFFFFSFFLSFSSFLFHFLFIALLLMEERVAAGRAAGRLAI